MRKFLSSISDYGKMVRFSHTLFALPFAGISFILAYLEKRPNSTDTLRLFLLILACMVSARNAAMGFNRIVDRKLDAKNPRTKDREIPAGKISIKAAWIFVIFFSLVFIFSAFFINPLSFHLAFPVLTLLFFYSVSKKFTPFCHLILGFAIGLAPAGAWIAVTGDVNNLPLLWTISLMFHIAGFDIIYSIQDVEFDQKEGLYSIPAEYGVKNAVVIAAVFHFLALFFFFIAGMFFNLGWVYVAFLGLILVLYIFEYNLIARDNRANIPLAFFPVNSAIGILLFIGLLIDRWNEIFNKNF